LETEPNLDPELTTDPDPKLQIITDPAGSGYTTLEKRLSKNVYRNLLPMQNFLKHGKLQFFWSKSLYPTIVRGCLTCADH
jgi:hypothetical protein